MIQQKVSLFQNLRAVSSKAIDLEEVVRLIQYDLDVTEKTEAYRQMKRILGKPKADEEVKEQRMPAVSVAVLFDGIGRKAPHVLGVTGLALCDIDHIASEKGKVKSEKFATAIDEAFEKAKGDPHTLIAYRTISGEGLRIIYRYVRGGTQLSPLNSQLSPLNSQPSLTLIPWKAAFLKGNQHFAEVVGHAYDAGCSDYTRLCGLAHDPDVYVNWEAEPFVVTDEEVLAANFDGKEERGKPRKEYPAGTHQVGVEEAWPKVEQTLQRRQMVYESGHHHDYVMHAAFLFNRYGVDEDELQEWADTEWSNYDAKQRKATIRSCYKKTEEHGTWRLNRQGRKGKETSMITLPEIREWLKGHVEVIYNVVTDMSMWRRPQDADWQQLDERVVRSMRCQMALDTGKRVLRTDVEDVLKSDFARLYHPVREYVETLPQWDGTDRVGELCSHLTAEAVQQHQTPEEAQELLRWALHKWMVAMVAMWMSDSMTNHSIFVLIGAQGIYKTTFFRHLLPPPLRMYFWENAHNSFSSKDDHLALAENCVVEIEEIDLQSPRDISELKALATSEKVKERRPYARFREEKHRLASFCGSGNQERFLSDDTGNRRWLCFKVSHIDDPRQWGMDYDQLYAQLRDEWRQGFQHWFDTEEQRRVERQNQCFRIESDEEQLIRTHLRPPRVGEKITLMNAASICQCINGGIVGRGLSTRKVSLAMGRLGFKSMHTKAGNFFKVFQIPVNEIQPSLAIPCDESEEEGTDEPTVQQGELPF